MICFICDSEIVESEPKFLVPLESPYCNLWIHRNHLPYENVLDYLEHNVDKVYETLKNAKKVPKKK